MKLLIPLVLAAALAACGDSDKVAQNVALPDLNTTSETPGDWSLLALAVGRTPADSGLLAQSPITVDLNAMLGREVPRFRLAMTDATALTRDGRVLFTVGGSDGAYLLIFPADHALEAGLKNRNGWQIFRTPASEIPRPAAITRLLAG